jgi:hypothetical protein
MTMQINLERRDNETRRWDKVATFDCGIYAMESARALSETEEWEWRVVDNRWSEGPIVLIYKEGVAT